MSRIIFITGGTRSGKSRLAERLAEGQAEGVRSPLGYIATASADDAEMKERIAVHQERRGSAWQTMEEPLDVCGVIAGHDGYFNAILIDCVTLWLTNMLLLHNSPEPALAEVKRLTLLFADLQSPLVIVSSEVGMGIVPENRLARIFRDLAGEANQLIAEAADEVYLAISGIPLKIKG
jgi:adenosylcobinamide kinase/adenosylcobinamide-phosphate guanylyltransferase